MSKKKILRVSAIFFLMAVAAGFHTAQEVLPYIKARQVTDRLADQAVKEKTDNDSSSAVPGRKIDFDYLKKRNRDIVGWIYIPGTQVDYPVLQDSRDNQYYLHHTAEKEENILGSIYLYKEASADFTDWHTIIFGHNMRSGQMFGELSNYRDPSFLEQYPCVYLFTPEKSICCRIYSAYICSVEDETFTMGYEGRTAEYRAFAEYTKEKSLLNTEVNVDGSKRIVSLVTCTDGGLASQRFVVQCIWEKEEEEKECE